MTATASVTAKSSAGVTLTTHSDYSIIRGLTIGGFPGNGIQVGMPETYYQRFTATCNVIGTSAHHNGGAGIRLDYVGGDSDGGVLIGQNLSVTTDSASNINLISYNDDGGIVVTMNPSGTSYPNHFEGNIIRDNGGLAIDLGANGLTPNDAGDTDQGANMLTNFPVLQHAVGGPNGRIAGYLQSYPGSDTIRQDITFYYATSCDPSGHGEGGAIIGTASVPGDASGNYPFVIDLTGLPTTGYVTAVATNGDGQTSEYSNCLPFNDNDSWPNAKDITGAGSTTGSLNFTGQARWYKFKVNPGTQVSVDLKNLPADYDLLLFNDINKAYAQLTTVTDLNQLGQEFSGSGSKYSGSGTKYSGSGTKYSDDAYSGSGTKYSGSGTKYSGDLGFSGDVFSGSGTKYSGDAFSGSGTKFSDEGYSGSGTKYSPDAYAGAQARSLLDFSQNAGLAPESIKSNTWNNDGYFYIRVNGRNGASADGIPFTLDVAQTGDVCGALDTYSNEALPAATGTDIRSVIITDPSRIAGTGTNGLATTAEKTALATRLASLAAATNGVVVDVSANARIQHLNAQADTKANCPYAKNLLAMALKEIVDSYRTPSNPEPRVRRPRRRRRHRSVLPLPRYR